MEPISIENLRRFVKADTCRSGKDSLLTGVCTDSRQINPGECFFAIKGPSFDGHKFVKEAFAKGATCAVVDNNYSDSLQDGQILLKVPDTVKALGDLARAYREQLDCKVIAITGSAGKTTTKELIYHVLSFHFNCLQAPESFNNDIGVPLTILSADSTHEIAIVELGSNYPGEIEYLSRIAQPDIAVITNIYPTHLAGFGNVKNIIKEKSSIQAGLKPNGKLLVNATFDELLGYCEQNTCTNSKLVTFGTSSQCDIRAGDIRSNGFEGRFTTDDVNACVPLAGGANIENAIAAWAVCKQFGISAKQFAEAIKTIKPVKMRMQPLKIGSLVVLNDCYNANPASMENALGCLAKIGADNGRLVFICGPMMELGSESEYFHAELGKAITKAKVKLLLTTGEFANITAHSANSPADYDIQVEVFKNERSVCDNLQKLIKPDDIILVKGSRTAKLEVIIEKLKELFA